MRVDRDSADAKEDGVHNESSCRSRESLLVLIALYSQGHISSTAFERGAMERRKERKAGNHKTFHLSPAWFSIPPLLLFRSSSFAPPTFASHARVAAGERSRTVTRWACSGRLNSAGISARRRR